MLTTNNMYNIAIIIVKSSVWKQTVCCDDVFHIYTPNFNLLFYIIIVLNYNIFVMFMYWALNLPLWKVTDTTHQDYIHMSIIGLITSCHFVFKGCICHFRKWQIHPSISRWGLYIWKFYQQMSIRNKFDIFVGSTDQNRVFSLTWNASDQL